MSSQNLFTGMYFSANTDLCFHVGADGGLADYVVVGAQNARKVPSNVSLEVAGTSMGVLCTFWGFA